MLSRSSARLQTRTQAIDWSVAQADTDCFGRPDELSVRLNQTLARDRVLDADRTDLPGVIGDHPPKLSFRQQVDGCDAKTRAQDAVKSRGASSTLQMAKHKGSRFPWRS